MSYTRPVGLPGHFSELSAAGLWAGTVGSAFVWVPQLGSQGRYVVHGPAGEVNVTAPEVAATIERATKPAQSFNYCEVNS